jgi:hypothetical protein
MIGADKPSPLEIPQACLGPNGVLLDARLFGLRWDTAAPLVLFLERDIARMLLMLTQRAMATLGKADPNLSPDRACQRT